MKTKMLKAHQTIRVQVLYYPSVIRRGKGRSTTENNQDEWAIKLLFISAVPNCLYYIDCVYYTLLP